MKNNQTAFEKYMQIVDDKSVSLEIPSGEGILKVSQKKINNLSKFCNKEIKVLADKIGGYYYSEGF